MAKKSTFVFAELSLGLLAVEHVYALLWELLEHVCLEASHDKRPHDALGLSDFLTVICVLVDVYRLRFEDLLQVFGLVLEYFGHDKVEQRHQLDEVVLEGRAGEQEAPLGVDLDETLVAD